MAIAAVSGMALVWWGWPLDTEALQALREEVTQLELQLSGLQQKLQEKPASGIRIRQELPMPDEPDLSEADTAWSWLQQRMQAHGLQVQALQPKVVSADKGLPQQAVVMRLQGRWQDWIALEEALQVHAPWWVIDQWLVAPATAPAGDVRTVRIELQARLGLRPSALPSAATTRVWPTWPVSVTPQAGPDVQLFAAVPVSTSSAEASPAVREVGPDLSADPRTWPIEQLRLFGVWRQAGAAYAVVGTGGEQVTLRQGQSIGRQAYRVRTIGDDHVDLSPDRKMGPGVRLTLQGGQP